MAYYSPVDALYTGYIVLRISAVMRVLVENKGLSVNNSLHGSGKTKTKMCRHAHADNQRYNNCCINRQTHTAIHRLAYCETETALTGTQPH